MPRTITLLGARGGSGTSTVAAALACHAATETTVALTSHDPIAMAHLLAVPAPLPGAPVTAASNLTLTIEGDRETAHAHLSVIDAGTLADSRSDGNEDARYLVARGPCYLALATFVARAERNFDGLVLLMEPGRAMTAANVADVTGLPVVATVPVHARVARCIDAGVLASRTERLPELAELKALAGLQVELHRTAVEPIGPLNPARDRADDLGATWEQTR
jgi:hypothetical protein